MCIVCTLWQKEKLTNKEARQALFEMVLDNAASEQHIEEVYVKITEQEEKENGIQD